MEFLNVSTSVLREAVSLLPPLLSAPATPTPNLAPEHKVQVRFQNLVTGQGSSVMVHTNDPCAVSVDVAQRGQWLESVRMDYARREGWSLDETRVWIHTPNVDDQTDSFQPLEKSDDEILAETIARSLGEF
jgi:hypothetical protein